MVVLSPFAVDSFDSHDDVVLALRESALAHPLLMSLALVQKWHAADFILSKLVSDPARAPHAP
jgi:hypothetical protein